MAFHLIRYAQNGDVKNVQKWIEYGVHIDACNVRKETALFVSSMDGHVKCVEFLLSQGADPNKASSAGMTPIHVAIQENHIKCVGLLLQYGSDLHSTFAEYPTVVAFARYHGNADVMHLLHAFMVDRGMGHHQPAQNYNSIVMNSCASASCMKMADEEAGDAVWGIPIIKLSDIKRPEHKHSFSGPFFAFIDGMWGGSLVTIKHAPEFDDDEFFHYRLRKEINILRHLRHFRFPVVMAICLEPFCLIMERFYHSTLSMYLRDPTMDMEKDLECNLMRIIRIMLDIAQALSHLHRRNWIHCHVSSQSILVCDGPRAKLGSLEFCERPGAAVEFIECFQEELPWLAPELLNVGEARFPADIYSLAATFWECLTRTVPWSWLTQDQIPGSRVLPILLCWPNLVKHLLSQCMDEVSRRPTADTVCRKLGEFLRLGLSLERRQLDEMFQKWLTDHRRKPSKVISRSNRSSMSSRSNIVTLALGEKYSSMIKGSRSSMTQQIFRERANRRRSLIAEPRGKPQYRRRSAVVTTLVEEALTTLAHVGRPSADVKEADIYKFGFKLARDIAELRGICAVAIQKQRKAWAKVAMATRDLEEDMFDSLAGYEEVTFRRKHAHAANLKKHHQEKEEEKLRESLDRKRSLIRRHDRKNWACYTMLLCDLYGILRRRDTIDDDDDADFEGEIFTQSIGRISSQMAKLSHIIVDDIDEDNVSGKFSSFPIDVAELARNSDGSVPGYCEGGSSIYDDHTEKDRENSTRVPLSYEQTPTEHEILSAEHGDSSVGHEVTPSDAEVKSDVVPMEFDHVPKSPEHVPSDSEVISTVPEVTTRNYEDPPISYDANPTVLDVEQSTSELNPMDDGMSMTSVANATTSADNAARSADNAATSADNAATSADNAATSADNAAIIGENATTSADKLETNADKLETSAYKLETSADKLDTSADKLETSAYKLETSAYKLETSADKLETSAGRLETSTDKVETIAYKLETSADKLETSADNSATSTNNATASVEDSTMSYRNIPSSTDGSTTFLDDPPADTESSITTQRVKSKGGKIRSFFKRKAKKEGRKSRYRESSV